ncbi:hypothetical protein [Campylobacter curvus]|uniref:hypothetical protein n=1 Tax=Campylobacter curvus TaxID=200 RepID=UPI0014700F5E|nr:hypothetical protein [Campylobacter curvus]
MDKKYEEFFEWVQGIFAKQELQRTRGLNDYNPLLVVRSQSEEVSLHSNVIARCELGRKRR